MDGILRRREAVDVESASPYPYESNFPEFNEFGTFFLSSQDTSTAQTNAALLSGTTWYQYLGAYPQSTSMRITITETEIILYKWSSQWLTRTFAGFPVKFKRCLGGKNNDPKVTYIVTKES